MRIAGYAKFEPVKLDLKDKKLLYYLSLNYRLTLSKLAELLNVSRETVKYRIERLKEKEIIVGSINVTNANEFGFGYFLILFKFHKLDPVKEKGFIEFVLRHQNLYRLIKCSGEWDLMIWIAARNNFEFNDILFELRGKCSDFLKEHDFANLMYEYKFVSIPEGVLGEMDVEKLEFRKHDSSFGKEFEKIEIELKPYIKNKKVDKIDLQILELFDRDVRIPLNELAKEINCSIDTTTYRIKRLVKENILQAFWPLISVSKLGFQWYLLFIQVNNLSKEREAEFGSYLKNHPFVVWANRLCGKWDVLVDVNARSLEHFSEIISDIRTKFADIVVDYDSVLMLKEFKYCWFCKCFYKVLKN